MVVTEREEIVVYFEKPRRWQGVLNLPVGFSEMEYDEQNEIIQALMDTRLLPPAIDYWDYAGS